MNFPLRAAIESPSCVLKIDGLLRPGLSNLISRNLCFVSYAILLCARYPLRKHCSNLWPSRKPVVDHGAEAPSPDAVPYLLRLQKSE